MKYIKLYEETIPIPYVPGRYWKVRTDEPYFTISLKKLGVPTSKFSATKIYKRYEYIYIISDDTLGGEWEWDIPDHINCLTEEEYMGEVEITKEEFDAMTYKMDIKKYNL